MNRSWNSTIQRFFVLVIFVGAQVEDVDGPCDDGLPPLLPDHLPVEVLNGLKMFGQLVVVDGQMDPTSTLGGRIDSGRKWSMLSFLPGSTIVDPTHQNQKVLYSPGAW